MGREQVKSVGGAGSINCRFCFSSFLRATQEDTTEVALEVYQASLKEKGEGGRERGNEDRILRGGAVVGRCTLWSRNCKVTYKVSRCRTIYIAPKYGVPIFQPT